MKGKYFLSILISLLFLVSACAPQQKPEQPISKVPAPDADKEKVVEKIVVTQPKSNPILKIVSPKDAMQNARAPKSRSVNSGRARAARQQRLSSKESEYVKQCSPTDESWRYIAGL